MTETTTSQADHAELPTTLGHHVILDIYGCTNRALLDDKDGLQRLFHKTAETLQCTIVNEVFHRFAPQGVSGVIVIAESHLSVHTWPEIGYAAVDLYTCGDPSLLDLLPKILEAELGAAHYDFSKLPRGIVDRQPEHRRQPTLVLNPRGLSADMNWLTDSWAEQILWTIEVKEVVRDVKTAYQRLQVVDTERLGRLLVLDGNIEVAEADESSYHETLVHTGLCRKGAPVRKAGRRVLIIGGGDGGAARECLRHQDVAHVDLIEIDREVVAAARDLLPRVWRHPDGERTIDEDRRLHIHYEDGVEWIKRVGTEDGPARYDLILIDSTDPVGPGVVLYTDTFYAQLASALVEGGAVCVQSGSFWYHPEIFQTVFHGLKRAFPVVKPLECFTAIYPGGVWNLCMATLGDDPEEVNEARAAGLADLEWYSARRHRASFGISPRAEKVLQQEPPPLAIVSERLERLS